MTASNRLAQVLLITLSLSAQAVAQQRPTVTFDNRSGNDALVRLAGPTSGMISVPDASILTVEVHGGTYRIYVRYGREGQYRYTRGDPFTVTESTEGVDDISITLHKVVGRNYGSRPCDEPEFAGDKSMTVHWLSDAVRSAIRTLPTEF